MMTPKKLKSLFSQERESSKYSQQQQQTPTTANMQEVDAFEIRGTFDGKEIKDVVDALTNSVSGLLIKNRKVNLKTYKNCFVGGEAVTWLLKNYPEWERDRVILFYEMLLDQGIIQHVTNSEKFYDGEFLYHFPNLPKFKKGSQASRSKSDILQSISAEEVTMKAQHPLYGFAVADRYHAGKLCKGCFVANEAVTWLVDQLKLNNRAEAVIVGEYLQERGYMDCASGDQHFKDKSYLFKWITKVVPAKPEVPVGKSSQSSSMDGLEENTSKYVPRARPVNRVVSYDGARSYRERKTRSTSPVSKRLNLVDKEQKRSGFKASQLSSEEPPANKPEQLPSSTQTKLSDSDSDSDSDAHSAQKLPENEGTISDETNQGPKILKEERDRPNVPKTGNTDKKEISRLSERAKSEQVKNGNSHSVLKDESTTEDGKKIDVVAQDTLKQRQPSSRPKLSRTCAAEFHKDQNQIEYIPLRRAPGNLISEFSDQNSSPRGGRTTPMGANVQQPARITPREPSDQLRANPRDDAKISPSDSPPPKQPEGASPQVRRPRSLSNPELTSGSAPPEAENDAAKSKRLSTVTFLPPMFAETLLVRISSRDSSAANMLRQGTWKSYYLVSTPDYSSLTCYTSSDPSEMQELPEFNVDFTQISSIDDLIPNPQLSTSTKFAFGFTSLKRWFAANTAAAREDLINKIHFLILYNTTSRDFGMSAAPLPRSKHKHKRDSEGKGKEKEQKDQDEGGTTPGSLLRSFFKEVAAGATALLPTTSGTSTTPTTATTTATAATTTTTATTAATAATVTASTTPVSVAKISTITTKTTAPITTAHTIASEAPSSPREELASLDIEDNNYSATRRSPVKGRKSRSFTARQVPITFKPLTQIPSDYRAIFTQPGLYHHFAHYLEVVARAPEVLVLYNEITEFQKNQFTNEAERKAAATKISATFGNGVAQSTVLFERVADAVAKDEISPGMFTAILDELELLIESLYIRFVKWRESKSYEPPRKSSPRNSDEDLEHFHNLKASSAAQPISPRRTPPKHRPPPSVDIEIPPASPTSNAPTTVMSTPTTPTVNSSNTTLSTETGTLSEPKRPPKKLPKPKPVGQSDQPQSSSEVSDSSFTKISPQKPPRKRLSVSSEKSKPKQGEINKDVSRTQVESAETSDSSSSASATPVPAKGPIVPPKASTKRLVSKSRPNPNARSQKPTRRSMPSIPLSDLAAIKAEISQQTNNSASVNLAQSNPPTKSAVPPPRPARPPSSDLSPIEDILERLQLSPRNKFSKSQPESRSWNTGENQTTTSTSDNTSPSGSEHGDKGHHDITTPPETPRTSDPPSPRESSTASPDLPSSQSSSSPPITPRSFTPTVQIPPPIQTEPMVANIH